MKLSVPSKTFVVGEYHVLDGGLGLVACTEPRFTLDALTAETLSHPFHPDSPAGRLAAAHASQLSQKY